MTPDDVGAAYDLLAKNWLDVGEYGFSALDRAIAFVRNRGLALDVGCGTGRLTERLVSLGFRASGVDVSAEMVCLARTRLPDAKIDHADVTTFSPDGPFDLIVAWDSLWHVPLSLQKSVLHKLCDSLSPCGVFLLTIGGTDGPEEKHDDAMGPSLYYATLGISETMRLLGARGCVLRHLEFDQPPEPHVVVIAQRR